MWRWIKDHLLEIITLLGSGIESLRGYWFLENWSLWNIMFFLLFIAITIWLLYKFYLFIRKKTFDCNQFGRKKETTRLVNKIQTGQSAAIIGIFGKERTELLYSLDDSNHYHDEADNFIFSKQDISILDKNCQPEQFWQIMLEPLRLKIFDSNKFDSNNYNELKKIYSDCQAKKFNNPSLDKLFQEVNQANLRVVLLLDRFHDILNKQNLNQKTFLGKLRSLSSTMTPSPLCLVITAHESLRKLHKEIIEKMPPSTSPFVNFMDVGEITLGPLSESNIDIELQKLKLSKKEQDLINEVGQHPYLIRIAYNHLKEAKLVQETNPIKVTKQHLKELCKELLDDMLSNWSSKMCQVFVEIAQGKFNNLNDDYQAELEELEKQGLIQQLESDQWQVFSPIFEELLQDQDISKRYSKVTK